jgi:hypothetical protein
MARDGGYNVGPGFFQTLNYYFCLIGNLRQIPRAGHVV